MTKKIVIEEIDIQYKPKSIEAILEITMPAWAFKFPLCDNCHKKIINSVLVFCSEDNLLYYLHPDCLEEC